MFKVGDKVRCIRPSDYTPFRPKDVYTITDIAGNYLSVDGDEPGWSVIRFELVEDGRNLDPVETIPAKRVLKEGNYGSLRVKEAGDPKWVSLYLISNLFDANEIDEMIFTLTQIREYLNDGN